MAVGFVASATSGSQASVASFNIGTLGTGARAGIVFVATHGTGDLITGVTWNAVAMTRLFRAADTDTEPGSVVAYFLDNVTNGVITVSRTNNAVVTVGYAASISALRVTRAYQTITRVSSTQATDADTSTTGTGASGEVAVDDASPGTSSMRFAAAYTGAATPVAQGTNSTLLQSLDSTALGSSFVRETTAGQGSRSVGFATGTTDDWALVAVAVREEPALNPQPTAASLTTTGATPVVTTPVVSQPTAANLTVTGATPTVTATANQSAAPTAASLTTTAATPTVSVPVATAPTAGALTTTGTAPVISASAIPPAASLTTTGATPAVLTPVAQAPDAASLTTSSAVPAVALPVAVAPDVVALATTLSTPAVLTPVVTVPDAASLILDTETPDVLTPVAVAPATVELEVAGAVPDVQAGTTHNIEVVPDAAALATTGAIPTVRATDNIRVLPGAVGLVTTLATPSVEAGAEWVIIPVARGLTFTMAVPRVSTASDELPAYNSDERLPFPQRSVPRAGQLGVVGASPKVRIGDDMEVLALLLS